MKPRGPIVITGFMGCGKSEVARNLAQLLNLTMTDLDELITRAVGRSPAELIQQEGEREFREIETQNLKSLLTEQVAGVIALGGGAWIESNNRELIGQANGVSVWIDTPFEICWQRITNSSEDRPLGRSEEQARDLFDRRLPIYALSAVRIAVRDHDLPEELAMRIANKLSPPVTF